MTAMDDDRRRLYSTSELATAAGVTPRTVRFYEAQGLLQPQRAGTMRVYTYRDRARLALIRRGKRLGFSLTDIAEFLELYGADPAHAGQTRLLRDKARARIAELELKLKDIQDTLAELRKIEHETTAHLVANHTTGPGSREQGRHQ
jgi:DNA-binding transcriptional MerR regulator